MLALVLRAVGVDLHVFPLHSDNYVQMYIIEYMYIN